MNTAYHIQTTTTPQKTYEANYLTEDATHEMLRQEVLENRRIQQIKTLRKISNANLYAPR